MLIVDGQIHLWEKGTSSPQHRQAPYSAEQAIAAMDQAGVDRALIHPLLWNPDSNELAQEAVCKYPNRFTIMGWYSISTTRMVATSSRVGKSGRACSACAFISTSGTQAGGRGEEIVITRHGNEVDTPGAAKTSLQPRPGPSRHTPHPRARGEAEARPFRMAEVEILPERRPTVSLVLDSSARSRGPTRRKPPMRCGRYSNCRRRWCIGSGALAARSRKQPDRRRPPGCIDVVFRNAALADLALLDIATDPDTDADGWTTTLHLADRFRLTLYDAVYVELAHRRSLPLASLDEELRAAARTLGVPVLGTAA